MSDSKFILVGKLIRYEDYYGEPSIGEPAAMKAANDAAGKPEDERLYIMFVLISDEPGKGGVHDIVAVPKAAEMAFHCIENNLPGVVMGNIRSFNRTPMLVATWITYLEPSNIITREFYPDAKGWRLPQQRPVLEKRILQNA